MSRARSVLTVVSAAAVVSCAGRTALPPLREPLTPTPDTPLRHTPPPIAPSNRPLSIAKIEQHRLDNGFEVWIVERPDASSTVSMFATRTGGRRFERSKASVAAVAVEMFRRGISGGGGHARVTDDVAYLWTSTKPSGASVAMSKIARAVQQPIFRDVDVKRARKRVANYLRAPSVETLAWIAAAVEQGGPDHLLAEDPRLRIEETLRVARADVMRYHKVNFRPETSAIIIVGAIDRARILKEAIAEFGGWTVTTATNPDVWPPLPPLRRTGGPRVRFVPVRATQAHVAVMLEGPAIADPNRIDFDVMMALMAGGFVSRAQSRLRHDQGLTYGVAPNIRVYDGKIRGMVSGWFDHDGAVHGARGLVEILRSITNTAITDEELERAKGRVRANYHAHLASSFAVANTLVDAFVYRLPPDHYDRYEARLKAIDQNAVRAIAQKTVDPKNATLIVTGLESTELSSLGSVGELVRTVVWTR